MDNTLTDKLYLAEEILKLFFDEELTEEEFLNYIKELKGLKSEK